jgi:hypothetical protein
MNSLLTVSLIGLGAVIMLLSIREAWRILRLLEGSKYHRVWKVLQMLMGFYSWDMRASRLW